MVRVLRMFVLVLAALSVLTLAVSARAQDAADCQTQIEALITATGNAAFTGQNAAKDEAGLVGKLTSANNKLAQGKVFDAVQALTQFRDKVVTLQTQGKIGSGDAQALIASADAAIACVQPPAA